MRTRESPVVFECAGEQLVGVLHAPERAGNVGVVIVVGGPQYRVGSHRQFTLMARAFANAGYSVFRFDYRGMGDSKSEVRTFEQVDDDIRAAIDTLCRLQTNVTKIVLWGLCDAASACLLYLHRRDDARVTALVLANPWIRTAAGEASAYLRHYYWQRLLQGAFWRKVFTGDFRFRESIGAFLSTIQRARPAKQSDDAATIANTGDFVAAMRAAMTKYAGSVLVLLSGKDLVAGEFSDRIRDEVSWRIAMSRKNVTVERLPEADHTFSNLVSLQSATRMCISWMEKLDGAAHALTLGESVGAISCR